MIRLQKVSTAERELLWNINQKYLYEMTSYYEDEMDAQGNYHYGYFDAYFIETARMAFFLYQGETMVGFAMVNPYSYLGHTPDYVFAEFTIFPAYRRKHYAKEAAEAILAAYPGKWEIKFHEQNTPAKQLWSSVTAVYNPIAHALNENETVLEFHTATK